MLVEEYLLPSNFDLTTSNQPEEVFLGERVPDLHNVSSNQNRDSTVAVHHDALCTVETLNSNILQVCLLLEGVGNCAKVGGMKTRISDSGNAGHVNGLDGHVP